MQTGILYFEWQWSLYDDTRRYVLSIPYIINKEFVPVRLIIIERIVCNMKSSWYGKFFACQSIYSVEGARWETLGVMGTDV